MRKLAALLVCLALVLCAAGCAMAESEDKTLIGEIHINGAFVLKGTMPEGYSLIRSEVSSTLFTAMIASEDQTKPVMQLAIAYEEIYSDVDRLNDLEADPEAMAVLERSFLENDPGAEITYDETGLGTRLLIARQSGEIVNYIDFMSIYKGHLVEFVLVPGPEAEDKILTDEQFEMARKFLTDLDFVPVSFGAENLEDQLKGQMFAASIGNYNAENDTVQITVMHALVLGEKAAEGLKEGGTLELGQFAEEIQTLSNPEDGVILINDHIELIRYGDEYHLFVDGLEHMEELLTVVRRLPEQGTDILLDDVDPETGKDSGETVSRSVDELREILKGEKYPADPGFPWTSVYIAFGEDGGIALIQRGMPQ